MIKPRPKKPITYNYSWLFIFPGLFRKTTMFLTQYFDRVFLQHIYNQQPMKIYKNDCDNRQIKIRNSGFVS